MSFSIFRNTLPNISKEKRHSSEESHNAIFFWNKALKSCLVRVRDKKTVNMNTRRKNWCGIKLLYYLQREIINERLLKGVVLLRDSLPLKQQNWELFSLLQIKDLLPIYLTRSCLLTQDVKRVKKAI